MFFNIIFTVLKYEQLFICKDRDILNKEQVFIFKKRVDLTNEHLFTIMSSKEPL